MLYFEDLKGKTLIEIIGNKDSDQLYFKTADLQLFEMMHYQDCCESVYIEDIVGDLEDVIGSPILLAEEVSQDGEEGYGSSTWTFYKLQTIKGAVTIRWFGSSNGYYSESVSFSKYEVDLDSLVNDPYRYSHLLTEEEKALLLLGQY